MYKANETYKKFDVPSSPATSNEIGLGSQLVAGHGGMTKAYPDGSGPSGALDGLPGVGTRARYKKPSLGNCWNTIEGGQWSTMQYASRQMKFYAPPNFVPTEMVKLGLCWDEFEFAVLF